MSFGHLTNHMRKVGQQVLDALAKTRHGLVSSYDPNNYAVKVRLQPDDTETGWLPLKSIFIGNGWGLFCPPTIGDAVEVDFQEGSVEAGSVGWRFFNDEDRPVSCPAGSFWLLHQSGSGLKFNADGSVELTAHTNLTATVGGDLIANITGKMTATASEFDLTGPLKVTGPITATQDITAGSISLQNHVHGGVQAGSANTATPH
jgi:phage baseplate assembly protein V